jgi:hypothetical protein
VFYTLYGHLSIASVYLPSGDFRWRVGDAVPAGAVVGWIGDESVNGGWPPHVHFQLNAELELGGWKGDYPGVCAAGDWPAYHLLCPDPNLLLRCGWVAPIGWEPLPEGGAKSGAAADVGEVRAAAHLAAAASTAGAKHP